MWPTSRGYMNPVNQSANEAQQQSNQSISNSLANNVDTNQLLMAADSLRTLFGDNISPNLLNSIRDNASANRMDASLPQMTSRRPQERHVIDYESPNYSRLDRNRLSQMSSDFTSNSQRFNDLAPLRTETRIYDPSKMPQKSILKKNNQPFEAQPNHSMFRTVEDEDLYLYGDPNMPSGSEGLPPGIVSLDQQNERCSPDERSLSPISLRLKREMDKIDRSRRQSEAIEDTVWTPRIGFNASASEPVHRNDWNDEEEEVFKRRYRDLMNPSPDSLELEKLRLQQMAAIQAGILTQTDKTTKRRELSPNSPLRHSDYASYRRKSPESSPKRVRRRSPSPNPRRKRSISPRRRSRSPRKRSVSPRRRSISPRSRRGYRSRSRERRRRSRTRSRTPPKRRSLSPKNSLMNLINPMPPMMRMPAPGMRFMPPPHNLVGMPMGSIMGQYFPHPPHPMPASYPTFVTAIQNNIRPNMPNVSPKQNLRPLLKEVPINRSPGPKSSDKRPADKKEDKLLNPHDLLVAERAKLRDELEDLKKQFQKKKDEQDIVVKKDGGIDSYMYKQLDKSVKELRNGIETKHDKLIKNFELITEVQKSKTKAKAVMEQLKASGDISKVDLKKMETSNKSKLSPKKSKSPDKKLAKDQPKCDKKEEINEEEEDEKSSRFHYFDSGPHYCKDCDKFVDNMKQYFSHIHSKEHMIKQKEAIKTPWITKAYIKELDKQLVRNKDQLVVASKGIQFILPTHGFFCELCEQFLPDSHQAEKHFRSAKHNRSYTRYTLLHNEFEPKWKSERDRAFTEMKRKERELRREEAQKKIDDRKRLEDEVKRKDREVKDKIEAMNKSLKSVKELDDPKTEQKKEDKNKSSPKSSIRLNLSKSSNESNEKSKSSEKSNDKKDKLKNKSRDKSEETSYKLAKTGDSMDTSDGIDDMLVIDEINCDSLEDSTGIRESIDMNVNTDGNIPQIVENFENNQKTDPNSHGIDVNRNENSLENVIGIIETSEEETKLITEEIIDENKNETIDTNIGNSNQIEGVMPIITANRGCNIIENVITKKIEKSEHIFETNPQFNDESTLKNESENKSEIMSETCEDSRTESTLPEVNNFDGSVDSRAMTYAEVVSKGSEVKELEDNNLRTNDLKDRTSDSIDKSGAIVAEELNNKSLVLDTSIVKTENNLFEIDSDIDNFNERLKNLDALVKKETNETEAEEDDPLDGFDVIDETNNEDNHNEDDNKEVIELSD